MADRLRDVQRRQSGANVRRTFVAPPGLAIDNQVPKSAGEWGTHRIATDRQMRSPRGGACQPNGSGDRRHPNHGAELVSRICDWEWLTRHFEAQPVADGIP